MRKRTEGRSVLHRAVTLVLTLSMLLGLLPVQLLTHDASAHWAQGALDKLVDIGVMRGDSGGLRPDANITRAEFVAMINRAYGYEKGGTHPFSDVPPESWYAEDIAIAYNTGYFKGTAANIASPNGSLTREEAVVMLGRNMMMQEKGGEAMTYADGREFSNWSRGYIETASSLGLVNGYADGTFRARNNVTRAEVATMLSNALGTVLNDGGEYTLGGVYGNVTINTNGTKLKDSVIAGDLYVTGGLDKGYATLENVTVLGRIIVSGGGEGNEGNNSVLLRNVDADTVIVDRFDDQFITLRAEGVTTIGDVDVRTSAFLKDVTPTGYGFLNIGFNADSGSTLDISGNIEKVTNFTPQSVLKLAKGSAQDITVDEAARESELIVDSGAVAYNMNLDTATNVDGLGSITKLNVAAPGSEAAILPDYIYIRPGITADINGEEMNSQAADQASEDPRLLSGYGAARNIAPTSFDAVFAANKRGTVYWAVTSVGDGSLDADELITPPTYATVIIKNGSVQTTAAGREVTSKVSGLTKGGTYYLSAVFVDERGMESPVKVTRFTTPDDTTPAFATGYPYLSQITNISAQVAVMTNKSCQLYWALLPKGSTAPTAQDFKSASIAGNLGYGTTDVEKNSTISFTVNSKILTELETYDLYLWLTDHDGAKSSAVKKVTFKTVDKTPPFFNVDLTVTKMAATSITAAFNLNEAGTVYWVAVEAGAEYPKPLPGQTQKPALDSDAAKLQVTSGINGVKSGKANATANKDGTITISGLEKESSYDIYYVAQDKAGNYSVVVKMITANTLDSSAPTVTQEFTRYYGTDTTQPLADTNIRIVFSEGVQQNSTGQHLLDLYNAVVAAGEDEIDDNKSKLSEALRKTIKLYPSPNTDDEPVRERVGAEDDWVIDYSNATVTLEEGRTVVTFRTTDDVGRSSALNLSSGASYYFKIEDIADTSTAKNVMGITKLPVFTTVFAQVNISAIDAPTLDDGLAADMSFRLAPVSTSKVDDKSFDMLLWTDTTLDYTLYYRVVNHDGVPLQLKDNQPFDGDDADLEWDVETQGEGWRALGSKYIVCHSDYMGLSLTNDFLPHDSKDQAVFSQLNALKEDCFYEYAIRINQIGDNDKRETWNKIVNMKISIAAGFAYALRYLAENVTPDAWELYRNEGTVTSIGLPEEFMMRVPFTDKIAPVFRDTHPIFDVSDIYATMELLLDRAGTVYYTIAPKSLLPAFVDGVQVPYEDIPRCDGGTYNTVADTLFVTEPSAMSIVEPNHANPRIIDGVLTVGTAAIDKVIEPLEPEEDYVAYFVVKGTGQIYSPQAYCFRFTTKPIVRPLLTLENYGDSAGFKTNYDAEVSYILLSYNKDGEDRFNQLLQESFLSYLTEDPELREDYFAIPEDKETGITPNDYTVLEALKRSYYIGGQEQGSVFDCFAGQKVKDDLAASVRAQSSSTTGVAAAGKITLEKDVIASQDFAPYMSGSTEHLLLAVAQAIVNGELKSGDAFKGIQPLRISDDQAPVVVACDSTLEYTGTNANNNPQFSGELFVAFDEHIYIKMGTGEDHRYVPVEINTGSDDATEGFVKITNVYSSSSMQVEIDENDNAPGELTNHVTFKITNAIRNATIHFDVNLCDVHGNTRTGGGLTLKLQVNAWKDPTDTSENPVLTYDTKFVISPKGWDGVVE